MPKLLKVWETWEDGAGFPVDDGQHNGLCGPHTAETATFSGLPGELRVPQQKYATGVTLGFKPGWGFVVDNPSTGKNVYLLGTDSPILGKVKVATGPAFTDDGEITYTGETLGQPAQYQGKWFFTDVDTTTSVVRELVTSVNGALSSDTITDGGASSGGGHLGMIGHQLAKFNGANGVSILTTGDSPRTGTWGSYFPVGDTSGEASGIASIAGLTFALREDGLYTFNDRGQSALVYRVDYTPGDFTPGAHAITYWKGGIVYMANGSLYYYTPGINPIDIGISARREFFQQPISPINKVLFGGTLNYKSVRGVGDFLFVEVGGLPGAAEFILAGYLRGDEVGNIVWNGLASLVSNTALTTCLPVFSYNGSVDSLLLFAQEDDFNLYYQFIHPNGSPYVGDMAGTAALKPPAAAEAYLSELRFPNSIRPTEFVVFPAHLAAGDYFQMSAFINGNSAINIGGRITADEPVRISMPPNSHKTFSMMPGVSFATTDTSTARSFLPTILRIELWGEEE